MKTYQYEAQANKMTLVDFHSPKHRQEYVEIAAPYLPVASQDKNTVLGLCEALIDILAVLFNVSGRALRSSKRHSQHIARIRQLGMYLAHVTLGLNMSFVGDGFTRDKSTVVYACHLIEDMRDDAEFDLIVTRLEAIASAAFRLELTRNADANL